MSEKKLLQVMETNHKISLVIEACSENAPTRSSIVGYCVYQLHPVSIEILTMAVHPDFREQGFGSQLIEKLKEKIGKYRFSICSYVAEDEVKSLNFFKGRSFRPTQIIQNLWNDGVDGIRMEYVEKGNENVD